MRIIDLVLTLIFGGICISFFGFSNTLDLVDIITLSFLSIFWLLPSIFKPQKCVTCRLTESKPEYKNFADVKSYNLAKNLWKIKSDFLDKMSKDIMDNLMSDLFVIHAGIEIKLITIVEPYALGYAQVLEDETNIHHDVSTLEAYLHTVEEIIRDEADTDAH